MKIMSLALAGGWNIKSIREVARVGYSILPKRKTTDFTMNMSVFLLVKLKYRKNCVTKGDRYGTTEERR